MDIQGTSGNDILLGTPENDVITSDGGSDLLIGEDGDDSLFGQDGDDAFRGGLGADVQMGGTGNDTFILGSGGDTLSGNEGADTFIVFPGGDLDIFPEEVELVIDAGPSQHRFKVELAETLTQQSLGLMFREDLAEDRGMLFDFGSEQPVAFFMKNTFIPLDILFIDTDGTIVSVAEQTTPLSEESIPSGEAIRAVLEVPAGTAAAFGIDVGDQLLHPTFGTADPTTDDSASGDTLDEGSNAGRGGFDNLLGFTQGEDTIDLLFFDALTFADIDTDGDGVLDDDDTSVAITIPSEPVHTVLNGGTVIQLGAFTQDPADTYILNIVGVSGLTADNFLTADDLLTMA